MFRPCHGGCGKLVPASQIHCENPNCQWKSWNLSEDAKVVKNGRRQPQPTTVPFPRQPLIEAWDAVARDRGAVWKAVQRKSGRGWRAA